MTPLSVIFSVMLVLARPGGGESQQTLADVDDRNGQSPTPSSGPAQGVLPAIDPAETPADSNAWLEIALAAMAVATVGAVGAAIHAYRSGGRVEVGSNRQVVVPSDLIRHLDRLMAFCGQLKGGIRNDLGRLGQQGDEVVKRSTELQNMFMTLRAALDAKDQEIARLKAGYDVKVYRNFVLRFAKVHAAAVEMSCDDPPQPDAIKDIAELLEDALDDAGVEMYHPTVGSNYLQAPTGSIADSPKVIASPNADDQYKIVEVLEPGYMVSAEGGADYVKAAKIVIFGTVNTEDKA
jgi:hypothetical protein